MVSAHRSDGVVAGRRPDGVVSAHRSDGVDGVVAGRRPDGVRTTRRLLVVLALLVVGALAASCGRSGAPPAPSASIGMPLNVALSPTVLSLPFVDQSGKTVRLKDFAGTNVVISDIMTLCQETCPLDTAGVVATARATEAAGAGDKVRFLSITVDPGRDTPRRLASFQQLYAPVPADWTLLTGSPADVATLWKALGVYWKKVPEPDPPAIDWMTGKPLSYDIEHSDQVFFVNGAQHVRFLFSGPPHITAGAPIPKKLLGFMDAAGHANLDHPDSEAWTVPQALQVVGWLVGRKIPVPAHAHAGSAT